MQGTADFAPLDAIGRQLVVFRPFRRQEYLCDPIPRPLVINDASRAKLADRKEPRARQVVVAARGTTTAGDPGREWKPREAVSRQEAFACEVPVTVEVR